MTRAFFVLLLSEANGDQHNKAMCVNSSASLIRVLTRVTHPDSNTGNGNHHGTF